MALKIQKRKFDQSKTGVRVIYELCRCPHITPEVLRVFVVIASYDPSFPSYEVILRDAGGMARKTLSNSIQELCARRMISYERGSARGRSNIYTILPETEWDLVTPSVDLVLGLNQPIRRTSSNRELRQSKRSTAASSVGVPEPVHTANAKRTKGKQSKAKQSN